MTPDELLQARIQWLTSAVRGLLKARSPGVDYHVTLAGEADVELQKEEAKHADLNLGPILLRYIGRKAQRIFENFIKENL